MSSSSAHSLLPLKGYHVISGDAHMTETGTVIRFPIPNSHVAHKQRPNSMFPYFVPAVPAMPNTIQRFVADSAHHRRFYPGAYNTPDKVADEEF